jgi:hypothetical protein
MYHRIMQDKLDARLDHFEIKQQNKHQTRLFGDKSIILMQP